MPLYSGRESNVGCRSSWVVEQLINIARPKMAKAEQAGGLNNMMPEYYQTWRCSEPQDKQERVSMLEYVYCITDFIAFSRRSKCSGEDPLPLVRRGGLHS